MKIAGTIGIEEVRSASAPALPGTGTEESSFAESLKESVTTSSELAAGGKSEVPALQKALSLSQTKTAKQSELPPDVAGTKEKGFQREGQKIVRLLPQPPEDSVSGAGTGPLAFLAKGAGISASDEASLEKEAGQRAASAGSFSLSLDGKEEEPVVSSMPEKAGVTVSASVEGTTQAGRKVQDSRTPTVLAETVGDSKKIVQMPVKDKELKAAGKTSSGKTSEGKAGGDEEDLQGTAVLPAGPHMAAVVPAPQGSVAAMPSPTGERGANDGDSPVSAVTAKGRLQTVELKKPQPQKATESPEPWKGVGDSEEKSPGISQDKGALPESSEPHRIEQPGGRDAFAMHAIERSHTEAMIAPQAIPIAAHGDSSTMPGRTVQPGLQAPAAHGVTAGVPSHLYAPHEPGTVAATPTSLEVGVPGGAHGWMKVRAELAGDGTVHASVTVSSQGGVEVLRRELPSLTNYLHQEQVGVSSVAVHAASSAMSFSDMSNGASQHAGAGGGMTDAQGGGARHENASTLDRGEEAAKRTVSEDDGEAGWLLPTGHAGAGGWLSVRA